MLRRTVPVVALVLAIAACGGEGDTVTTTTAGAIETSTSLLDAATTTEAAPSTTEGVTTTTPADTTPTTAPPSETTEPPSGLPETFVAITTDYAAVEVATATGEILHEYGQEASAADLAAAEEIAPNVLVGIWRLQDGSMVGIADCCEPAAGNLHYLYSEGNLTSGSEPAFATARGWTLSPSPTQNMFAELGYSIVVADPSVAYDTGPGWTLPDTALAQGTVAWGRDGSELFWTMSEDGATALYTLDLAEGSPTFVADLAFVGDGEYLDGIGSQANGNLVGFLHTVDSAFNVSDSEGVVFTTAGELLASFPVEVGAAWGGYDTTGSYLIYTDGDGNVRWQGGGGSGTLGEGFFFASW